MKRSLTTLLVVVGFTLAAGCAQETQPSVDQTEDHTAAEIKAFQTAYLAAADKPEQVALVEQLLIDYPSHDYAGFFAQDIVKYYSGELGQPEKAYEILDATIAAADDPVAKVNLATILAPVAAELERPLDFDGLVAAVDDRNDISFFKIQRVMDAAAILEDWELEESVADHALERSSVEAYRVEFPDRDFSDEEFAAIIARRRAEALAYKGWAVFNLGRADQAMALFEESDLLAGRNYVGLMDVPHAVFVGSAFLQQGEAEAAIEAIGPEAIFGDRNKAEPVLREAYAAVNGSDDGFEEFLVSTRQRLAPQVHDFVLTGYDGEEIALADLRRDKVTMLAFWFPT